MIRFLLAILISVPLCAQPLRTLLTYADPASQALLGVEWSRIARSQYVADAKAQFAAELQAVKGLEFLDGLERFVLSAAPGRSGKPASVLLLIEGRFNIAQLRQMALEQHATAQQYRGVEILSAPQKGQGDMDFAIVDGRTLLAGDRAALRAAIDRMQSGGGQLASTGIGSRALSLSARTDIWGVASPEIFSAMGLKEAAAQLKSAVGNDPMAAELFKALKTLETGGPVEFGVSIDELQKNAPKLAELRSRARAALPRPAPVQPPPGSKVKIYGLEGGMKEVDFK